MSTPITTKLLASYEARAKASETNAKPKPSEPSGLRDKHASIFIIIKNKTQFDVKYISDSNRVYWNYGGFYGGDTSVDQWDVTGFGVSNVGWTKPGVGGGLPYEITLDKNTKWNIAIGFTDPPCGKRKAGVVASTKGQEAWDVANEFGGSIQSTTFSGKDDEGQVTTIRLEVSIDPGETTFLTLSQVYIT